MRVFYAPFELSHGGHHITRLGLNWIDHRASLARAIDRTNPPLCTACGCELDINPVPHSPRCKRTAA